MSRRPCHFYNKPGGCGRGNQCGFSHGSSSSSPGARPSGSSPAPRQGPLAKPPPGVCKFYWSTGKCLREFDCNFRHTQQPSPGPSLPPASIPRPPTASNSLAPFLTEAGLAKLNASGTDIFFTPPTKPLSPNEIHNNLRKFLRDEFRFEKTFDIYGFLVPLASLDPSGPTWVSF